MSAIVWVRDKDEVFVKAKVVKDYTNARNKLIASIASKHPDLFGIVCRLDSPQTEIAVRKEDVWRYNFTHDNPAPDLASINDLNEPAVLNVVRERLRGGSIYTKIEPLVISVNPYRRIPMLYDLERYHALPYEQREAHVYCIARNALHRVSSINQSIAVSRESGAGKTEACKLLISYLTSTAKGSSQAHSNSGGLDVKILACNPILEAFGNASTLRNDNSSRFGKYLRLQVQHGSLCGAELVHYLLEKGRVTDQHPDERTFHIFYQLLAGANNAMLSSLMLDGNALYKYLGATSPKTKERVNDSEDFFDLVKALSDVGVGLKTQNDIFRLLASILHLGNFEFEYVHSSDNASMSCSLKPSPGVEFVSKVLGIPASSLGPALTNRTVQTSGRSSFYSVPLSIEQSTGNAAALAKELYNRLFAWIIFTCNARMSAPVDGDPGSMKYIGILDIFGFEVFDENRFEQMCINYCNEKIQAMFNTRIFESEIARLVEEGIPVDGIAYETCTDCLSLLEGESGIFKLTDEFCFLGKKNEEDLPLLDIIDKTLMSTNPRYVGRKSKAAAKFPAMRSDTFVIKHFAGDAMYSIHGFIAANGDKLENDLSDVIRSSDSVIIQQFYEVQSIMNNAKRREEEASSGKRRRHNVKKVTISAKFRENLKTLITELESTNTQFLRCIKPNQEKSPDLFDAPLVYSQLRYSGVIGVVAIRKCSFPLRQTWSDIHQRLVTLKLYKGVSEISLSGEHSWGCAQQEQAAKQLFKLVFPESSGDYYSGKSIVYMKQNIYEKISDFFSTKSVICIQQRWRGVITRQRISKIRNAIIKLQRLWWQKCFRAKRMASVILCQSFFRMSRAKMVVSMLRRIREVSYLLNRWKTRARIRKRRYATLIRLFLLRPSWRLPISRLPPAHNALTRWFRSKLTRLDYLKLKSAVTRISAWYRGRSTYYVYRVEIIELRVIYQDRLEKQSALKLTRFGSMFQYVPNAVEFNLSSLLRFFRTLCFRHFCTTLFANVKAGLVHPVKLLLRRIRRHGVLGAPPHTVGSVASGVTVTNGHGCVSTTATLSTGPLSRGLTRSLTGGNFDVGSSMPLKYSSFLPSIGADGEVTPGTAVLAGVGRFGRSAVLRDVNINDIRDSSEGFATLLHTASNHGFSDVVTLLLEAGSDPTKTDSVRFTPLHRVMRLGEVGYPVVDLLLCSTHELAGMKDLYGRTARDIAEEKSSEYDNTELQMLEMLKYSENIYYEKLQLAERKKNQVEAAAKSISIDSFLHKLEKSRESVHHNSSGVGNDSEDGDAKNVIGGNDMGWSDQQSCPNIANGDTGVLSDRRNRFGSAPPTRVINDIVRRGSMPPQVIVDSDPLYSGLHQGHVYKQTRKLRKGSLNMLDAKETSIEKRANLARFIQSTMKRKPKKPKNEEPNTTVSAPDLFLKRAFMDAWGKSNLLSQTKSITLEDYLMENTDSHLSVLIPPFESEPIDHLGGSRPQASPLVLEYKTRVPFSDTESPSVVKAFSPLKHSNNILPLTRPRGMEALSIVIPDTANDDGHDKKDDGNVVYSAASTVMLNEPTSVDFEGKYSKCNHSRLPSFVALESESTELELSAAATSTVSKSRGRRNSIVSNISSFDVFQKQKVSQPNGSEFIGSKIEARVGSITCNAAPLSTHIVGSNKEASVNVDEGVNAQIEKILESNEVQTSGLASRSADGCRVPDSSEGSFWTTWNQYVRAAGREPASTAVARKGNTENNNCVGRVINTNAKRKEDNRANSLADAEYQRLIAKRKLAEKDPVLKVYQIGSIEGKDTKAKNRISAVSDQMKKIETTRSCHITKQILTDNRVSTVRSVLQKPPASSNKAVLSKTQLPPRLHAYPPGVPGKR